MRVSGTLVKLTTRRNRDNVLLPAKHPTQLTAASQNLARRHDLAQMSETMTGTPNPKPRSLKPEQYQPSTTS